MSNIPTPSDDAEAILAAAVRHAWRTPITDNANQCHIWRCTRGDAIVYQPFGAPVPCELISHPQEHGQMRGELS